jgi:aspartate ammonia-lyase
MTAQVPTRKESDSLGEVTLAGDCLYGINIVRGRENFAISHRALCDEPAFIRALARVKKAAALANYSLGARSQDIANAVVKACDEIVEGRHHEHFVIDMLEGSGGTSINMNANEVIANRALQIIGAKLGDYRRVHPNDHVNMGQSTNDVVPTALKLAVFEKAQVFLRVLESLKDSLAAKSIEFSDVSDWAGHASSRRNQ